MDTCKFAPVAISVYDRPHHFKACIESLRKNVGAEKTVLYISSDGPGCDNSKILVQQVREYIKTIHGFKKIILFAPNENTRKTVWFETRQKVSDENERFIITEDDNIFSPFFLDFINNGLEIFADEPRVAAICGYNYPGFPFQKPEAVSLRCHAGWGYGTWRGKDLLSRVNQQSVATEVFGNKNLFAAINAGLPHMAPMMRLVLDGKLIAGDVTLCSLLYKENKVCIFPSMSLVRNMGNDGSGEHCGISSYYEKQLILEGKVPLSRLKSLDPLKHHSSWLHGFFGGKFAELINWKFFWDVNLKSPLTRIILRFFFYVVRLIHRMAGFVYHCLKRNFS